MSNGAAAVMSQDRLDDLTTAIEEDIANDRYFGGSIAIYRHGKPELVKSFGHADGKKDRPVNEDAVFSLFSVTKAFTNVLIFRAIEAGRVQLTTKVSEVIPEFKGGLRDNVTLYHLLTHSAGFPSLYAPKPEMNLDRFDEIIRAIVEVVYPLHIPGERVDYSPMVNHALMGEIVQRVDRKGRSFAEILEQDVLRPLQMDDTAMGRPKRLADRHIVPDFRGNSAINHLGSDNLGPNGVFEQEVAVMPWVGMVSTVADMVRFGEMLRREGELDGQRILSPAILRRARQIQTGDKPNQVYLNVAKMKNWEVVPAYIGLGFSVRGHAIGKSLFGSLNSPETFGNYGAGTTFFWVDPALDMTFVGLMTGVMSGPDNMERWQKLSDIAVSSAL